MGSVLLEKGETDKSIELLRRSLSSFRAVGAPYDEAQVRFLIARASQKRGDTDTAQLEIGAAREIFIELGAAPDLERVERFLAREKHDRRAEILSRRELEVLKLVAFGKTNREVANDLFISEKTVARHISNIFDKLDLSSRSAATAYAFKNQLV
jgi:DNA-binding NarL/FixJ family response regulator